MRILGLDIGDKRIGVALSDPQEILASSFTVLLRKEEQADLEAIVRLVKEHGVQRIVVGLPRSLDGSLGPQAHKVLSFSQRLSEYIGLPVDTWDERFSTVEAERLMVAAGVRRAKRKERRDAVVATIILQGYLDRMKAGSPWKQEGEL